jgi:hypothetical protein
VNVSGGGKQANAANAREHLSTGGRELISVFDVGVHEANVAGGREPPMTGNDARR